ncbi:hypothetical protein EDB84DRAFT_1168658 [Lactarius hengduanensis]|nr:hypothetical protein EDB84DRAFT_1168658 [Lactarius hengduanensis]
MLPELNRLFLWELMPSRGRPARGPHGSIVYAASCWACARMNSSPGPCALRVTSPSGTQSAHICMQISYAPTALLPLNSQGTPEASCALPLSGREPLLCRIFKGVLGIVRHQGMMGRAHAGIGARVVHHASCSAPYCPAAWSRRDLAPYLPNRTAFGAGNLHSLHDACAPFPHGFSRLQKFIVQSRTCRNVALPRSIIAKGYL